MSSLSLGHLDNDNLDIKNVTEYMHPTVQRNLACFCNNMEENGLVGLEPIAAFIGEQRRPTAQASWEPKAVTALAGQGLL